MQKCHKQDARWLLFSVEYLHTMPCFWEQENYPIRCSIFASGTVRQATVYSGSSLSG